MIDSDFGPEEIPHFAAIAALTKMLVRVAMQAGVTPEELNAATVEEIPELSKYLDRLLEAQQNYVNKHK